MTPPAQDAATLPSAGAFHRTRGNAPTLLSPRLAEVMARLPRAVTPIAFLTPFIILVGVFTYWPLIELVYLSFVRMNPFGPDAFVGMNNYAGVIGNTQFRDAAINSLIYIFGSIPLKVVLPLAVAMFIWTMSERLGNVYKSILFVPTLLSFVVVAIIWIWMLNPVMGLIQTVISPFGLRLPNLLSNRETAIHVIIFVSSWKVIGFNVLLYLAGLSAIGKDYIEAMRLDGAGDWTIFRKLIVPLLSPTIFFVGISTVVFTIQQVFTPIDIMTGGGPLNGTTNIFYIVYQYLFESFNVGYSAAGTVLIFLFLGFLVAIKIAVLEKRVHYH